ncbi:MAG: alkaline phosphatase [Clostridia bacterium]|nr:alkaline phosphatase [Clostridia bacterium]
MFAAFILKFLSALTSFVIAFCTTFGIWAPSTTKEAAEHYDSNIKNVIFLIGDGMGFNHLNKTKLERKVPLTMDTFEIQGASMTRSFSSSVTDSAAGATALSTGIRTNNGALGVYPLDLNAKYSYPKNIREICAEKGMMTGVVTTDSTGGATPSGFSAHESDRDNNEEIMYDQLASDIDLIWGASNGVLTEELAAENGFDYVATYSEMMALEEGSRSFGQFTNDLWTLEQSDANTPNLEQMAVKAVDLLDDADEGFFLMIEGAHIDKHSHNNDGEKMTEALEEFDRTIAAMLEYAEEDGETLVIVTADHETGVIKLNGDSYTFTSGSHSGANVPLLVYGTDKLITKDETINNYEIPIRIAYILGFDEDDFPFEVVLV